MHLFTRFNKVGLCLGLGILLCSSSFANPIVTGTQVRQFLGGRSGKIVYTEFIGQAGLKNGRTLYYLDFNENDTLVEHPIITESNCEPRNPQITRDGQWITYSTYTPNSASSTKTYVCRLMENATQKILIGSGSQPHWWVKPSTGEEYIIYTENDIEFLWQMFFPSCKVIWYPLSCDAGQPNGYTYMQKLDANMQPAGSRTTLVPYYANGGRSHAGGYLFASSRATGIYQIDPNAIAGAAIYDTVPFDTAVWGCNPSLSPHNSDADVKLLWLGASQTSPQYDHRWLYISKPDGTIIDSIVKSTTDGNVYWDTPRWSTHPDFASAVGSAANVQPPFNMYLIRLTDKAALKLTDGNEQFGHVWINDTSWTTGVLQGTIPIKGTNMTIEAQGPVVRIKGGSGTVAFYNVKGERVATTHVDNKPVQIKFNPGYYIIKAKLPNGKMQVSNITLTE